MPIIEGGTVIPANPAGGEKPRTYYGSGAPVAGTTYADVIQVGEFYVDTVTGNLYEYTEPASTPTFTRIDTA